MSARRCGERALAARYRAIQHAGGEPAGFVWIFRKWLAQARQQALQASGSIRAAPSDEVSPA